MGVDEEGTLERLKALRRELLDPKIAEHRGCRGRRPAPGSRKSEGSCALWLK
jgi:hypothetical protein